MSSFFEKLRFKMLQNVLRLALRQKIGVFKFSRFEERFRKAAFSWLIRVEGKLNRRNIKVAFQISPA